MDRSKIGEVSIAELLGREAEPVYGPEAGLIVEDATVLVTGSGGSIGSEIVRQLLHLGARKIVCLDNSEYALYLLERELQGTALLVDETIVLADIRDSPALNAIFMAHTPQLVFHAAAYKHLPLLEKAPASAVLTNTLGTHNVATACVTHGVKRFVNISTDKAADPISVLGMSKRLAEMLVKQHAGHGTRTASVRFGNVFGSRGSFVETFVWQIANGLPVTVTDRAMTRYFMTIPQAAGLVIEAAVMADEGNTYVLDMGERYSVTGLIDRYAMLSGAEPPQVMYTGLRKGEKIDEVLYSSREVLKSTRHSSISMVRADNTRGVSLEEVMLLCLTAQHGASPTEVRTELARLVTNSELPAIASARA